MLRGEIPMSIENFPGILGQRILAGRILVGRLGRTAWLPGRPAFRRPLRVRLLAVLADYLRGEPLV